MSADNGDAILVQDADDPVARAFRQYLAALRAHRARKALVFIERSDPSGAQFGTVLERPVQQT